MAMIGAAAVARVGACRADTADEQAVQRRQHQAMLEDVFKLSEMTSCIKRAVRKGPVSLVQGHVPRKGVPDLSCWIDQSGNCYFISGETDPYTGRSVHVDITVRGESVNMSPGAMVLYPAQPGARTAAALGACRAGKSSSQ